MVVRRTLAMALLIGLVALGIGALVAAATFPSSEELQRESLARLGLDPDLVDSPLVRLILDEFGGRVEDHVVDEARRSAFLGAGAGGLVVVAGFALVLADARRRDAAGQQPPAAPSGAPPTVQLPVVPPAPSAPPTVEAPAVPPPPPSPTP
jgi:ABC-type Fe3+ transport system permease subunit